MNRKSGILGDIFKWKRLLKRAARHRIELLQARYNKNIPEIYPDFLCIGAPRTGTSWLANTLDKHPDVFIPARKEAHFFDEPVMQETKGGVQDINSRTFDRYFDMADEAHWRWYYLQFAGGEDKVKGDITPAYSRLSSERISLVAKRLRDVKIIYMLRDPVQRVWSGVTNFAWRARRKKVSDMSMQELTDFAMHPRRLMSGDYKSVITLWEKYIGRDRMLYLFYDDLADDPYRQAAKVCEFLGIAPPPQEQGDRIRQRVNVANESAEMPREVFNLLKDYYEEQIPFLEQHFDRDFSHWSGGSGKT